MDPTKDLTASAFYLIHTHGNLDCGPVVIRPLPLKQENNSIYVSKSSKIIRKFNYFGSISNLENEGDCSKALG